MGPLCAAPAPRRAFSRQANSQFVRASGADAETRAFASAQPPISDSRPIAFLVCSQPAGRRQHVVCSADRQTDGAAAPAAAQPAAPQQQRRRHVLSAAAGAALLAASQLPAAQAVIKGYEPMPGLQGKDYGKQRMR